MAEFINWAETAITFAALVAVIWSAIVFVRDIYKRREAARKQELLTWQKASVQEMLHSAEHFLTVEQITEKLRSASFESSVNVEKHELTAPEVQLLLLEMLEARQIAQLWGDRYGIESRDIIREKAFEELRSRNLLRKAYDLILLAPGKLTTEAIRERLEEKDLSVSDFYLALFDLQRLDIATLSNNGVWTLLYPPEFKEAE